MSEYFRVVIIDMYIQTFSLENSGKWSNSGSVLTVNKYEAGYFIQVYSFEAGEIETVFKEEFTNTFLL